MHLQVRRRRVEQALLRVDSTTSSTRGDNDQKDCN